MAAARRALVLGMGNPILSDDAVGCRLARDLGRRLGAAAGLRVVEECSVGGLNLLEVISGCDLLVAIDSIRTAGGEPGSWYRFTAARLRETQNLSNVHDANFATALELGRRLGHDLPRDEDVHVFAVEIDDSSTFGEAMTPALEARYSEYSEEIFKEIEGLLAARERG